MDLTDIVDGPINYKNIYNKNNVLITKQAVEDILSRYGVKLKIYNISIWINAFSHRSYCTKRRKKNFIPPIDDINSDSDNEVDSKTMIPLQDRSNETYEWVGDGILQGILTDYLYSRYYDQNEEFLTKIRSKLAKTKMLSFFAMTIGLDKYILMSRYMEKECNGRNNQKILENTFEAFIGALHIYCKQHNLNGYKFISQFVVTLIETEVDITELICTDDNYKHRLMLYYQKMYSGLIPKYTALDIDGPTNSRIFNMCVLDSNDNIIGNGTGRSKKDAEQLAAKEALNYFGIL
jgi:ribonuclease-3